MPHEQAAVRDCVSRVPCARAHMAKGIVHKVPCSGVLGLLHRLIHGEAGREDDLPAFLRSSMRDGGCGSACPHRVLTALGRLTERALVRVSKVGLQPIARHIGSTLALLARLPIVREVISGITPADSICGLSWGTGLALVPFANLSIHTTLYGRGNSRGAVRCTGASIRPKHAVSRASSIA